MFKNLKRFIRNYALRGRNVECCLCQNKFITFLPSGDEIKAHSRCPACYAVDRNRQLWLIIKPLLENSKKTIRLLHLAPEKPISVQILKMKHVQYDAIDKFEKGYTYPSYVKPMDITELKFESNVFDYFLCSHVLEHVEDDKKAMQELLRVLKPGGTGFIMAPYFPELELTYENPAIITPEERKQHFGQADHIRKYGSDFVQKLNTIGFDVKILSIDDKYSKEQKIRLGLINAEPIFEVKNR